jgi:16S rRNA (guanine1207-N2)-methyltransferase
MSRRKQVTAEPQALRTPPAEQLLIEELPALEIGSILCTSLGRGQFARMAGSYFSSARVVCQFLDSYQAAQAMETTGAGEGNVTVSCSPDFPDGPFDLVAIPVDPRGEAELTRDYLQSGYERLAVGGRLMAATSAPDDQWLHAELRKLFAKVTRRPGDRGVFYVAVKSGDLKKRKNFECEFAFRDQVRLIKAVSRPGVFNHRSLDAGARALLNTMHVREGDRVVDLGCGSGAVALAAAFRAGSITVVAVDSNARAVECTNRGAQINGLTNVTAIQNADGEVPDPGTYDLVLGNPPYFSDYRIAEIFLQGARRALKPGGRVLMVSKSPAWFENRMPEIFENVQSIPHKQYTVVEGTRGGG